jgi:hypothetical protein
MLAVGANGTAIMAALPTMRTELFLSSAGVQWAVKCHQVQAGKARPASRTDTSVAIARPPSGALPSNGDVLWLQALRPQETVAGDGVFQRRGGTQGQRHTVTVAPNGAPIFQMATRTECLKLEELAPGAQ